MRIVANTDVLVVQSNLRRTPQESMVVRFKRLLAVRRQAAVEARITECVIETDHPGVIADFAAARGRR